MNQIWMKVSGNGEGLAVLNVSFTVAKFLSFLADATSDKFLEKSHLTSNSSNSQLM